MIKRRPIGAFGLLMSVGLRCLLLILIVCVLISTMIITTIIPNDHPCPDLPSARLVHSVVESAGRPPLDTVRSKLYGVINCQALMEGNERERTRATLYMKFNQRDPVSDAAVIKNALNCEKFKIAQGYDSFPVTAEELNFPIAFSILVHKDIHQVERLLRAVYRSHNFYCVHVDAKSEKTALDAVRSIANCFHNVFLPPRMESITYAHISRLNADISCMRELLKRGDTWKYVINLTGQMYPLKTNLEIVKILQTFEETNDIEGLSKFISISMKSRYEFRYEIKKAKLTKTRQRKDPPPHNITLVKGSAYGAFTRRFIDYALHDPLVQEFLNWTGDIYSPDEFFWATLNSRWLNPMFRSPGGHDLPPERKPWIAAYAAWMRKDSCGGKFVRDVCIFGVADLPNLIGRRELFANKFYAEFQYLTLDCIDEWLTNKTKHFLPIDLEYYRNIRQILKSGA